MKRSGFLALGLILSATTAFSSLIPTQNVSSTASYIQSANSTLYAIRQIKNGTAKLACRDQTLVANLNNQGYNGDLIHNLTCEVTVGIIIFPDLTKATKNMQFVLISLRRLQTHPAASTNCSKLSMDTLYSASLDVMAIRNLLCGNSSTATNASARFPAPTSTLRNHNSSMAFPTTSSKLSRTFVASTTNTTRSVRTRSLALQSTWTNSTQRTSRTDSIAQPIGTGTSVIQAMTSVSGVPGIVTISETVLITILSSSATGALVEPGQTSSQTIGVGIMATF